MSQVMKDEIMRPARFPARPAAKRRRPASQAPRPMRVDRSPARSGAIPIIGQKSHMWRLPSREPYVMSHERHDDPGARASKSGRSCGRRWHLPMKRQPLSLLSRLDFPVPNRRNLTDFCRNHAGFGGFFNMAPALNCLLLRQNREFPPETSSRTTALRTIHSKASGDCLAPSLADDGFSLCFSRFDGRSRGEPVARRSVTLPGMARFQPDFSSVGSVTPPVQFAVVVNPSTRL